MNSENNEIKMLEVQITSQEKALAKKIAKQRGMTLRGFLGLCVRKEINASPSSSSIPTDNLGVGGEASSIGGAV